MRLELSKLGYWGVRFLFIFMINLFFKPYRLFLFSILGFGAVLSLSAENWLAIWVGLEINLYCFVPLLLIRGKNQEKEAAVKYFISQAVPSAIMVFAFILYSGVAINISSIIFLSLLIKLGIAPVHFWLPSVIGAISWEICWVLRTIQKLAPIIIIFRANSYSPLILVYCAGLSRVIGGIGGFNQTLFRVILAYSSIGHIGWILAGRLVRNGAALFYFLNYLLIISALIFFLSTNKISGGRFVHKLNNKFFIFFLLFFSLGGLPPLMGFYPKIIVLSCLAEDRFFVLSFILILGSVLNLYYYLKLIFLSLLATPTPILKYGVFNNNKWRITIGVFFTIRVFSLLLLFRFLFI